VSSSAPRVGTGGGGPNGDADHFLIAVELAGGLAGGATCGVAVTRGWARRRRSYVRLVVEPYRSDRLAVDALVSALAGLHALVSVRGPRRIVTGQPSIALEIHHQVRVGGAPLVWLAVCAPCGLATQVGAAIRAAYPNCRLRRVRRSVVPGGPIVRLHKRRVFSEPVRRVGEVDPDRPPVERLLRAMGAAGGWSVVQIALSPAPLAIGRLAGRSSRRPRRAVGETESVEIDDERLTGPFFGADFRLLGQRAGQLTGIAAELRSGRAPNRLVGRRARGRRRTWAGRIERGEANLIPTVVRATYAVEELAALWHLPSPGFAAVPLVRCATPLAPAPAGIRRARTGGGLLADEHGPVTIHPELRRQNTAVVGTVEQGKTSYLVASVREDLRREDCAVVVLDPKGDAADAALSVVPDGRVCTLLDMARPTCGFNPLAVAAPVDAIADYVVAGVRQLFADGEVRGSSDRYLRNAVIAALAYDRGCSLWDVSRLLEVGAEGTAARSRVADRLVGVPEFAEVASFLAEELPVQLRDARSSTTAKLDAPANKLARVLNSTSVKRVLLNESLRIDFDRVIEGREVVIVRGGLGELGTGNVSVLMQLLLGMLDAALGRAQDRREAGRRTAVALKVDEAPLVINESFAQTMALKRSAGLETVACWQTDAQWPVELRDKLDALFAHRVLFATASAVDARAASGLLMAEFADQLRVGDQRVATLAAPDVRLHLPRHTAVVSWGTPTGRDRPFIGTTIPLRVDANRLERLARLQEERGGREVTDLRPPRRLVATDRAERWAEVVPGRVGQAETGSDSSAPRVESPAAGGAAAAGGVESHSRRPAAANGAQSRAAGGPAVGQSPAVAGSSGSGGAQLPWAAGAAAGQPEAVAGSSGSAAAQLPRAAGALVGQSEAVAGSSGSGGVQLPRGVGAVAWAEGAAGASGGEAARQAAVNVGRLGSTGASNAAGGERAAGGADRPATLSELEAVDAATSVRWLPVASTGRRVSLDPREFELLSWIAGARCVLSSQAHRRTSPGRALTTTQRRLKRLADAGLVARFQLHGGDGGGAPFCCAATAPALDLLELGGRRPPVLDNANLAGLRRDLHTVGWLLALEAEAGDRIASVLGPGRARVAPPVGADLDGLGLAAGVHARDFVSRSAAGTSGRPVESFVGVSPAAAVEVRVACDAGLATTDLLVFHEPADPSGAVALLERVDHLVAGWWRLVPRYARLGGPPTVVIVASDRDAARTLGGLADGILVACLARIGEQPGRWAYPGREGVVFAAEGDVHRGLLDGWRVAALPPAVRSGQRSGGPPSAAGSGNLRRGAIVELAGPLVPSEEVGKPGPAPPWR
jgi:hypothetical protein